MLLPRMMGSRARVSRKAGAAAAWAAGRWAFHGFALSYDEVMPRFQAEIFRSGRLLAPIPPEMAPFQRNLILRSA